MQKAIIFLGLFCIIVVSGCINIGFLGTKQAPSTAFVGGTEGIRVQFQNLPSNIFPEVPFRPVILVQNVGEATIGIGEATFVLNNAERFGVTNPVIKNKAELQGTKRVQDSVIAGSQEILSYERAAFAEKVLTEEQRVPIGIDACYPYQTTFVTRVCVARGTEFCQPVGFRVVQNSGAPIQITEFRQIAQPEDGNVLFNFQITVENRGPGLAYSADSSCPRPTISKQDFVNIREIRLGDNVQAIDCSESPISLFKGKGSTTCSLTIPVRNDFEEQLSIILDYVYLQSIGAEITVIPT